MHEKELIDYHNKEITEEDKIVMKKKKRTLDGIRRELKRNHTFHCMPRHVGKGIRQKELSPER